jgi:hypothetical protein
MTGSTTILSTGHRKHFRFFSPYSLCSKNHQKILASQIHPCIKNINHWPDAVAQECNLSYWEDGEQEDCYSRSIWAKIEQDSISTNNWVSWHVSVILVTWET